MYSWELPTTLEVGGESYEIRSDFRPALDIIAAFNDPQLPDAAKLDVMVTILYVSPPPAEYLDEAVKKALWFLDCGRQDDGKTKPRTMDWEQDAAIIFPAVNKIAGYETRNPQRYTHWWSIIGYFNEIEEGLFSQVLALRQKLARGKKLEKWEREFLKENRALVELRAKISDEEKELRQREQAAVDALFK